METKSFAKSKLNWLGLVITILGVFVDPQFQSYLKDVIPPDVFSRIISLAGMLTILLRTCFTSQPIVQPKKEE